MSGIYSIVTDWGDAPRIVRIQTTDLLSTVGTANYILLQAANISAANNGAFQWQASDVVLVYAADGWAFFSISSNFNSLNPIGSESQQVSIPITATQIDAMYDTPILLIPAPAAGTLNLVQSAVWNINYGGTVFANGGAIVIQYKNTVHGAGVAATATISAATLIAATANTSLIFGAVSSILSANTIGQALYLSNASGDFTGGTSTTTVLNIIYRNVAAV